MGPYVRLHFLPKYQDIFENDYLQHEVKYNDQWELELHPDLSKLVTCSLTSQYVAVSVSYRMYHTGMLDNLLLPVPIAALPHK